MPDIIWKEPRWAEIWIEKTCKTAVRPSVNQGGQQNAMVAPQSFAWAETLWSNRYILHHFTLSRALPDISLSPYETDLKRPNPGSHLRPNVRRSIPMRFGFNYEYVHSPNLSHLRCRRLFQPFVDVHSRFDDLYLCRSASNISKAKLWRLGAGALPCFLCGLSSRWQRFGSQLSITAEVTTIYRSQLVAKGPFLPLLHSSDVSAEAEQVGKNGKSSIGKSKEREVRVTLYFCPVGNSMETQLPRNNKT